MQEKRKNLPPNFLQNILRKITNWLGVGHQPTLCTNPRPGGQSSVPDQPSLVLCSLESLKKVWSLFLKESSPFVVTDEITELGSFFNLDLVPNCKLDMSVYISKYSMT